MLDEKKRSFNSIFIYPRFQLSLIALNIFILVSAFLALIFQNYFLFSKLHEMGRAAGLPQDHTYHQFIQFQEDQFILFTSVTFFMIIFFISLVSLFISHRVAGPILRLKNYLVQVGQTNQISELVFRKNSFFNDLPKAVNDCLKSVREKNKSK